MNTKRFATTALVAAGAVAAVPAMSGAATSRPAATSAALRHFEGTVISVDRPSSTFRLRDVERGTVRVRVTSATRFERVGGLPGLRPGERAIEVLARRSGSGWVAAKVERSGGGGRHGGGDPGRGRDDARGRGSDDPGADDRGGRGRGSDDVGPDDRGGRGRGSDDR
jgi:hypothetical protein